MVAPIALQLYTLRDLAAQKGYEHIVRLAAEIGYVGVETAGFPGTTPGAAGKLFKSLGLQVTGIHSFPVPTAERKQEILDTLGALDTRCVISGGGPDQFKNVDDIKAFCELFNQAVDMLAPYGITVGMHNHWWEYLKVGERYAYEYALELLDPRIIFQLDTYWIKVGGCDPVEIVAKMGARAPLLHIKDGPANRQDAMQPIGSGVIDVPGIVRAGAGHIRWLIVELDRCDMDMVEAVRQSYAYLVGQGLARGNV